MFGIYIHIPFCKKACTYCDFHFSTAIQSKQEVLTAILHEISSRKQELNGVVDSIYFGGGTPTAIDLSSWNSLWTVEKIKSSNYHPSLKTSLLFHYIKSY